MISKAKTPKEYVDSLNSSRKAQIEVLRKVIHKHLPKGYEEVMLYGMLCYAIPLKTYPKGYLDNPKMPLCYFALASQKNYMAIYHMGAYADKNINDWIKEEFKKHSLKLDMGKSCIRFKKLEDLPPNFIAELVSKATPKEYIKIYEAARNSRKKK